jgi:plastocyanin
MKYARYAAAVFVILFVCSFAALGQEVKQETKPGAPAPEAKPEVKQEAAQPTAQPEAKPVAKDSGKEKRIVATVGADGVQKVEIIGGEYYFDPNYIVVKVNVPVELNVKKAPGYVPHNIAVKAPEAGIDFKTDMDAKKPDLIKFTPTKIGRYPMYCDKQLLWFKSHRERGMEGTIEVVP